MRLCSKHIPVAITVMLLVISCTKNNSGGGGTKNIRETTAPQVIIVSPIANQVFNAGDTIHVKASATDNVKLTELHIHVLNKETGALLRDIHSYPYATSGTVE